jgi:hypothetical protein
MNLKRTHPGGGEREPDVLSPSATLLKTGVREVVTEKNELLLLAAPWRPSDAVLLDT